MDVISSSGWLNPALTAMEMSQMAAQAMWDRDSHLLQLPHVTKELAAKAAAAGVETVFDLQEMEVRARLLAFDFDQVMCFCLSAVTQELTAKAGAMGVGADLVLQGRRCGR